MKRNLFGIHTTWCALVAILLITPAARADETQTAREILQVSGVKAGLAVHLGCGRASSPALTAALAQQSNLLVHGLAVDKASADRAMAAINDRSLAGRAMVECVSLHPLPYLNDLANLIVVEDMDELSRAGVTRDEIMRVLAPGGTLCQFAGGKWSVTVQPRPASMDDWSHPQHGADGNMVSNDKIIRFPLGFRWLDGIPFNVNAWASCRGWIVAGGRCYTLSSNHLENLKPGVHKTHYLSANDAWNGLPLWKINCETEDNGAFLTWLNAGPLVADEHRVYAVKKDKVIAVDGVSGQIMLTYPTPSPAGRLLLADGTLVASCWEGRDVSQATFEGKSLWATWVPKSGCVQAYDAATGKLKFNLPYPAESILAADGALYLLTQAGNPAKSRQVIAVDLQTGKERWRVATTKFDNDADFQLNTAGRGFVIVARRTANAVLALSASNGDLLWKANTKAYWTPIVDGLIWVDNQARDPLSGQVKETLATHIGGQACTPSVIANGIITKSRGCGYTLLPPSGSAPDAKAKVTSFGAARGACMEGMVPANGMFYTAQNWCRCAPAQVYGFVAVGPTDVPPKEDFEKARDIEKGPAFGSGDDAPATPDNDWPCYRHDAQRSASTPAAISATIAPAWSAQLASAGEGTIGGAWRARLTSCLSAPVIAGGRVYVARTDAGQLLALDAGSGKQIWCATLGGRIDTPPAIHRGLCFLGAHDGYVYALRCSDGQLAWRARVAPEEKRMVAFGSVESVWPAWGAVLIHDGVLYAHAGRSSESDGGVALAAFEPLTGKCLFARAIPAGAIRQNDILRVENGDIFWHQFKIDAKTGQIDIKAEIPKEWSQGGLADGSWTLLGKRRGGNAFHFGSVVTNLMARSASMLVTTSSAYLPEQATAPLPPKTNPKSKWTAKLAREQQVEAIALAANAVVYAGRKTDATAGTVSGFLMIVSLSDGKTLAEQELPAPPTYDGVAIANSRIYVSLQSGQLMTFTKP